MAKGTSHPQVASQTQCDDSVQVVSPQPQPQPLRFDSPPAIPLMEFQNQPDCIGSKPNTEKPMGKFLSSPGQSLFNKGRQQEFQQMCDRKEMATTILVRWDKPIRCSTRIQNLPMTLVQKQQIAHEITQNAMKDIGGIVGLQACLNESFDKDPFMSSLIE